jgi:hypothetical protein
VVSTAASRTKLSDPSQANQVVVRYVYSIHVGIMFKICKRYIFIRPTVWGGKGREGVRETA